MCTYQIINTINPYRHTLHNINLLIAYCAPVLNMMYLFTLSVLIITLIILTYDPLSPQINYEIAGSMGYQFGR